MSALFSLSTSAVSRKQCGTDTLVLPVPKVSITVGKRPTMESDYHHQGEQGWTNGEGKHEVHQAVGQGWHSEG